MSKEEIVEIVDRFLNEKGQWFNFKSWLEEQGYSVNELGFEDE